MSIETMKGQFPSLGRIVMFCIGKESDGLPILRPATVVRVRNATEGYVNLKVDLDGLNDVTTSPAPEGMLEISEADARACTSWRTSIFPGEGIGEWSWPPRV